MKIGIDAKWYFDGPVSNRNVIRKIVENLIAENPGHELFFFLNRKHKNFPFEFSGPWVHPVYVWGGNNLISNVFLLPFCGKKLGLDGILYQNFGSFWGPNCWVYIHDVVFLSHPQFFTRLERSYFSFMPFLLRFAHKIITISYAEKRRMESFGLNNKTAIDVVYHGRDDSFVTRDQWPQEGWEKVKEKYLLPERYLLFVGRLNFRKNLGRLLRALFKVENCPQLLVIGEKDWKTDPALDQLAIECERLKKVRLLGKISQDDLPIIYSGAEVFCFFSLAEGFGLPVLEAMASGVPVLTSKNSAMEEVCGEAACYADPENVDEIAEAIDFLTHNSEERKKMAALGLCRKEKFNWKETAQKLFSIFEKV
jgi:glycosyltransferase involved in cell wall biosynthesis